MWNIFIQLKNDYKWLILKQTEAKRVYLLLHTRFRGNFTLILWKAMTALRKIG